LEVQLHLLALPLEYVMGTFSAFVNEAKETSGPACVFEPNSLWIGANRRNKLCYREPFITTARMLR
jgi:hypothetical protein